MDDNLVGEEIESVIYLFDIDVTMDENYSLIECISTSLKSFGT